MAAKDHEFRQTFHIVIADAGGTCGDRVALSLIHLGIARKLALIDISNAPELAEFLIRGVLAMNLLEECARKKTKTLRFFDEIEVYLGFPIQLKECLQLPIDAHQMLYFSCSALTIKDLDEAYNSVSKTFEDKEAINRFLISNDKWKEALSLKHPEVYAEIEKNKKEAADETLDCNKFDQIEKDYEAALTNLTSLALSAESWL